MKKERHEIARMTRDERNAYYAEIQAEYRDQAIICSIISSVFALVSILIAITQ